MKKIALLMAVAAFVVQANAQFTVSVKVDMDNDSRNDMVNVGGEYDHSRLRTSDTYCTITPSVGYELDEWEVGIEIGIMSNKNVYRNYTTGDLDTDKEFGISPSVYGRRNFSLTEKLSLFAECNLGFTTEKDKDSDGSYDKITAVNFGIYPGLSYKLTDSFVLEAFFSHPEFNWGTSRTSYYDNNGDLWGDGATRTYCTLTPFGGFRDFLNGISFGISYCF